MLRKTECDSSFILFTFESSEVSTLLQNQPILP